MHISVIDVGRFKHTFEGFCENFIYPMSKNKERITTSKSVHPSLVGNSSLSYPSLLVKRVTKEIESSNNDVDIISIWTHSTLTKSFNETFIHQF